LDQEEGPSHWICRQFHIKIDGWPFVTEVSGAKKGESEVFVSRQTQFDNLLSSLADNVTQYLIHDFCQASTKLDAFMMIALNRTWTFSHTPCPRGLRIWNTPEVRISGLDVAGR
jgi:hypothetical protein